MPAPLGNSGTLFVPIRPECSRVFPKLPVPFFPIWRRVYAHESLVLSCGCLPLDQRGLIRCVLSFAGVD